MDEKMYKRLMALKRAGNDRTFDEQKEYERLNANINANQGSQGRIQSNTPQLSRKELIRRSGPLNYIKNIFIKPEEEWLLEKQYQHRAKIERIKAQGEGLIQESRRQGYSEGKRKASYGGVFGGWLGNSVNQMGHQIAKSASRGSELGGFGGSFDHGFGGGRRGRGGGHVGLGFNPITGESYGHAPRKRHKSKRSGRKNIILRLG